MNAYDKRQECMDIKFNGQQTAKTHQALNEAESDSTERLSLSLSTKLKRRINLTEEITQGETSLIHKKSTQT